MFNYSTDFEELRFVLNSKMRTNIMILLFYSEEDLDSLKAILDKPSSTLLHTLHELILIELVKKVGKVYYLSPRGHIFSLVMHKFISNLYFITNGKNFLQNHSIKSIPDSLLKDSYLLINGEYVVSDDLDLSKPLNEYLKIIEGSRELNIVLPIFSQIHLDAILAAIKSKESNKLNLITSNTILKSIKKSGYMRKFALLSKDQDISIWKYNGDLDAFLTFGKKFTTLSLFFNDGHFDDSVLFVEKTAAGRIWSKKFFEYYVNKSIKVL